MDLLLHTKTYPKKLDTLSLAIAQFKSFMNIVFDKNSLKVISLLNSDNIRGDEDSFLQKMFPSSFKGLSVWRINESFNFNPIFLRIGLDENKNPDVLFYKDRGVYKLSDEEKKKNEAKRVELGKKSLVSFLPRMLRSTFSSDIIKTWMDSPHTFADIKQSLMDYRYFSDEKLNPVCWSGPFTDAGGYANMNREIVFRLHNYHILPKVESWPTALQISNLARFHLSKYAFDFRRVKNFLKIHSFTPHPVVSHGGRLVFFTMMETETLHPEFVRLCNQCPDEIWVPSNHNRNVFRESGVKKPICVMPLGIDDNLYRSTSDLGVIKDTSCFVNLLGRPAASGINDFRFISLFGWSYRKGIDILIKSFVEEFNDNDKVALIVCSRHAGSSDLGHQNVIKTDAMRFAKEVRAGKYPQVVLYPHVIPENQMPSIYRMGHVFVHFSRGEGFSLPQIEASASGLPVISCNNTGMSEYLTDDNAYLVKTKEKESCSPEMHWITAFYHGQLFPKLGRDQIEQARKHMRFVLNNYPEALEKGKCLRREVFEKYTWQKTTERVSKRIKEIYQNS